MMDGAPAGADLLALLERPSATTVSASQPGQKSSSQVTILLSTFNGEKYLQRQLASFLEQENADWRLVWRDDGSSDSSCAIMESFSQGTGFGRCIKSATSGTHLGAAASFLLLLKENQDAPFIAFADQDDCWLPLKLQRSLNLLGNRGAQPALFCARQILTDEDFSHPAPSMRYAGTPGFPACLAQNIATGSTIVMNRAAAKLVSAIALPEASNHDWWSYIVVSACGGTVVYDEIPSMLYRQHAQNMVGSQRNRISRAIAALERGAGSYMTMMRRHIDRLYENRHLLPRQNIADLRLIRNGLVGGYGERVLALRCASFRRGTRLETFLFRIWYLTF